MKEYYIRQCPNTILILMIEKEQCIIFNTFMKYFITYQVQS